jgi:hypothetical protein
MEKCDELTRVYCPYFFSAFRVELWPDMKPQPIQLAPTEMLTRGEVASIFKVTKHTVRMFERRGQLASVRINPRVVRYELAAVQRLRDEARV